MVTKTKQIMLLRHARAEPHSNGGDFYRSLTISGQQQARDLGQKLLAQKLIPQAIYCSTARRAMETAEQVCEQLAIDSHDIVQQDGLYQADADMIRSLLRGIDNRIRRILIVGHNPALEMLIQTLLVPASHPAPLHLSPADMVMLKFEGNWAALQEHSCSLDTILSSKHRQHA